MNGSSAISSVGLFVELLALYPDVSRCIQLYPVVSESCVWESSVRRLYNAENDVKTCDNPFLYH